ncbi:MAG TPA: GNAT family N-acetyltransferase [Dissulfurispiraceae bacterium]|nr:GNAT family N-acetyltransferase [Dissulfurispiraceae bacterium]
MDTAQVIYRRAQQSDYPALVGLQQENLFSNLSKDELKDGFLSIAFTPEEFGAMNSDLAVVIAERGGTIVGYLCGTTCTYARQFPILRALLDVLQETPVDGTFLTPSNTFIYGPVCVAKHARGSGILAGLVRTLCDIARDRYAFCALFIADANRRSLRAHLKLGMDDLGTFESGGMTYHALAMAL